MNSNVRLTLDHIAILGLWYKDNFSLRDAENKTKECMDFVSDLVRVQEDNFFITGEPLFGHASNSKIISVDSIQDMLFIAADRVKTTDELKLQGKLLPLEINTLVSFVDDWLNYSGDYKRLDRRDDENSSGKLALIMELSDSLNNLDEWVKVNKAFADSDIVDWGNIVMSPIGINNSIVSRPIFPQYTSFKRPLEVESFVEIIKEYASYRYIDHGRLVDIVNNSVNSQGQNDQIDNVVGRM